MDLMLACGEDKACEIMGCSPDRLAKLRRTGKLKEIGRGWYALQDLRECIDTLRSERDKHNNVIHLEAEKEPAPNKGRPGYQTSKKLLRQG